MQRTLPGIPCTWAAPCLHLLSTASGLSCWHSLPSVVSLFVHVAAHYSGAFQGRLSLGANAYWCSQHLPGILPLCCPSLLSLLAGAWPQALLALRPPHSFVALRVLPCACTRASPSEGSNKCSAFCTGCATDPEPVSGAYHAPDMYSSGPHTAKDGATSRVLKGVKVVQEDAKALQYHQKKQQQPLSRGMGMTPCC